MNVANPLGFGYGSVTNVELYEGPSAMLVTGEGNRHNPAFKAARARGVEVLTYLDLTAYPNGTTNPILRELYMGDPARVPIWGKDENGKPRSNWPGKTMIDTRVGSAWSDFAVERVADLMRSDEFSGVFLDVVGCRQWVASNWDNWPAAERQEWTAGCVDLVRRLHLKRMEINPDFLIVNNNIWIYPDQKIDASVAEQYVDGICIEGHKATVVKNGETIPSWHWNHVKRRFANLGQRRVLIISNSDADALVWATHPDVTHVASVFIDKDPATPNESYKTATPPVVRPTDVRLMEALGKVQLLRQQLAAPDQSADTIAELQRQLGAARTLLASETERADAAAAERDALVARASAVQQRITAARAGINAASAALSEVP